MRIKLGRELVIDAISKAIERYTALREETKKILEKRKESEVAFRDTFTLAQVTHKDAIKHTLDFENNGTIRVCVYYEISHPSIGNIEEMYGYWEYRSIICALERASKTIRLSNEESIAPSSIKSIINYLNMDDLSPG